MVGLILIVAGTILLVTVTVLSEETVVAGAVIFVGPIPIVVGAGACFIWALVLAVALAILGILMFLICRKRAV